MDASPRLMLLDAASLYYRAFYGVPDRRKTPDSPPSNAVRGFLDMIATLVQTHRPTHLVACWDEDWRPDFRVAAIPSYKTHRLADGSDVAEDTPDALAPQVPAIVDVLAALGIARVGAAGYEADDVIGTLVHTYAGELPIDVVTGDRDLFQVVDDRRSVRVLYTARGGVRDADVVDEAYLLAKYAVSSGPAYADMAVLRGDTSDGLPGVPGIGEKSAAQLIETYGDLRTLRAAVDGGDPAIKGARRARLEAASDYLDVAPTVVQVATDAPLPGLTRETLRLPREVVDPRLLSQVADELGVGSSVGRVLSALAIP
ncbi:5'-3' exonuclease [Arsenicicoccus sp. oral taxon 190]|uniref:5'-3' exonuclease n=1 Tax=Arsenicicoccus sp. oral taxon 190 TaxID=1658671 RepID=UPI00067A4267|nr:5'-3' exonuclease [Arsenicicoccus sp. oral taxon 190]AKT51902.1 5'-3' exonuclease [Arsenicicoccus sp. oral taxon 190]